MDVVDEGVLVDHRVVAITEENRKRQASCAGICDIGQAERKRVVDNALTEVKQIVFEQIDALIAFHARQRCRQCSVVLHAALSGERSIGGGIWGQADVENIGHQDALRTGIDQAIERRLHGLGGGGDRESSNRIVNHVANAEHVVTSDE